MMVESYTDLTDAELNAHKSLVANGYKAIHSSGEAHFFLDRATTANNKLAEITASSGLFDRNKLISPYSNGVYSKTYPIAQPSGVYRDPGQNKSISINTTLNNATFEFNMYSLSFRKFTT